MGPVDAGERGRAYAALRLEALVLKLLLRRLCDEEGKVERQQAELGLTLLRRLGVSQQHADGGAWE